MLVCRFLDGLSGAAFLSVAGGTIRGLWCNAAEQGSGPNGARASRLMAVHRHVCEPRALGANDGLLGLAVSRVRWFSFLRIQSAADGCAPFRPEIGPLIGGFINQYTTWYVVPGGLAPGSPLWLLHRRWTFYVLLIWTAVQLAMITLLVPETYPPVLLRRKAERLRKKTGNGAWTAPIDKLDRSISKTVMWSCIRPFQLLLLEPMVCWCHVPRAYTRCHAG